MLSIGRGCEVAVSTQDTARYSGSYCQSQHPTTTLKGHVVMCRALTHGAPSTMAVNQAEPSALAAQDLAMIRQIFNIMPKDKATEYGKENYW